MGRVVQERDATLNKASFQCHGFSVIIPITSLGDNVETLTRRPCELEAWAHWLSGSQEGS